VQRSGVTVFEIPDVLLPWRRSNPPLRPLNGRSSTVIENVKGQAADVVDVVQKLGIARSRDFDAAGINRKFVATALKNNRVLKLDRGLYASPGFLERPHARLVAACMRIQGSVICLQSAAHFYGLIDLAPEKVWVAIAEKARDPSPESIEVARVWFSGAAMTQGVVNRSIGGVPFRIYSPMKTIADLLKYRNKGGIEIASEALFASVRTNQYSPYRLLHFARICRVEKLARAYIRQLGSGRVFEGRQLRSEWGERL
jgi:predicted transcriptional regulator of viral defense system